MMRSWFCCFLLRGQHDQLGTRKSGSPCSIQSCSRALSNRRARLKGSSDSQPTRTAIVVKMHDHAIISKILHGPARRPLGGAAGLPVIGTGLRRHAIA
eukprot:11400783-Heterocapsa_arctica.AAC.1